MPRICIFPKVHNVGGPLSFQQRFVAGLERRGIEACFDLRETPYDAVLVIGGTKHLAGLLAARSHGIRIVQRLDGINWLHRRRRTGWFHFLRAEYGNFIQSFLHRWLSTHIVYQSRFAQQWWETRFKPVQKPVRVIHNGVDLNIFSPGGPIDHPSRKKRLLVIEGSMGGGYEQGLVISVSLAESLAREYPFELMVVGHVPARLQTVIQAGCQVPIHWAGVVPGEKIPALERSAHLLYSADINPACPNAVIEALACGLPVVAFDTGALSELVTPEAGCVVPYGGDPWELDPPDIPALKEAAVQIISDLPRFRRGARMRAEAVFNVEQMMDDYLQVLLGAG